MSIEKRIVEAQYMTSALRREAAEEITRLRDALAQSIETVRVLQRAVSVPDGFVFTKRETLADLVVREACETEPADPDDPDTIKIRTHDLRWAALAAMLAATSHNTEVTGRAGEAGEGPR